MFSLTGQPSYEVVEYLALVGGRDSVLFNDHSGRNSLWYAVRNNASVEILKVLFHYVDIDESDPSVNYVYEDLQNLLQVALGRIPSNDILINGNRIGYEEAICTDTITYLTEKWYAVRNNASVEILKVLFHYVDIDESDPSVNYVYEDLQNLLQVALGRIPSNDILINGNRIGYEEAI